MTYQSHFTSEDQHIGVIDKMPAIASTEISPRLDDSLGRTKSRYRPGGNEILRPVALIMLGMISFDCESL